MKKVIFLIFITILTGCANNKVVDFQESENVKYINENKSDISSVIVHKITSEINECYSADIEEAYKAINNIEIIKKTNISVTDDYLSYRFIFNGGEEKSISFEAKYLNYNNKNYIIDNFPAVILSEENIVKCE